MKIIVSSLALLRCLMQRESIWKRGLTTVVIYVRENKLGIDGIKGFISIEAEMGGHYIVEVSKLKCLWEVLKLIQEQPLTLSLDNYEIEIQNITF